MYFSQNLNPSQILLQRATFKLNAESYSPNQRAEKDLLSQILDKTAERHLHAYL